MLQSQSSPASDNFQFYYQTIGTFRVMGDHPKKRLVTCTPYCYYPDTVPPVPFPSTLLGDPSDPSSMQNCAGDCHLAIVDVENWISYEFFRAMKLSTGPQDWQASPAIYDLKSQNYNYAGSNFTLFGASHAARYRGTDNGANVSGNSFAAWNLKADEILDGEIQHVLAFNFWTISSRYFVYPATKIGGAAGEAPCDTCKFAPPLGLRLRMKPSYDIVARTRALGSDSTAARIILRAMQKYGVMCLQVAGSNHTFHMLTDALPDKPFTSVISPNFQTLLKPLALDLVNDFEVVDWDWQYQQYANYPKQ
jgi:hypothetical protein